jgi:hypothetical protein
MDKYHGRSKLDMFAEFVEVDREMNKAEQEA